MRDEVMMRDAEVGRWLHFHDARHIIEVTRLGDIPAALRQIEHWVEGEGLHAAGFIAYEAATAFDPALPVREPCGGLPLLWFGLFTPPDLQTLDFDPPPGDAEPWQPTMDRQAYSAAISEIKRCIADGETYQVNFTFRLRRRLRDDPHTLFRRLIASQPSPYSAFIETDRFAVCSASPELFFRLDGQRLVARPMKGTAPRGRTCGEDLRAAETLAASEKNRAENAMIVDMMRNDFGRVAIPGSVGVSELFRTERYPTLWQMTSTVAADTRANVAEIMAATFPCASVTGAPKPRTMQIIARLETTPRGVYTGCIGRMAPGRKAQFSVAIRTAVIDKTTGQAEYGVGGGVVWDSTNEGEYQECLLKAQILGQSRPAPGLLETMLWTPGDGYFLLDRHLRRLGESAEYFGIATDPAGIRTALAELAQGLSAWPQRVRFTLSARGQMACEAFPLALEPDKVVRVGIAAGPIDSADALLYHKTTRREVYDAACASRPDCDDVLLFNERGQLTESSIANVVVRVDGRLVTPPVECGLLAGVFRGWLLDAREVVEAPVDIATLRRAEAIYLINSVRKWRKAALV